MSNKTHTHLVTTKFPKVNKQNIVSTYYVMEYVIETIKETGSKK